MGTKDQPWYAKASNVAWMLVFAAILPIVVYFAFPRVKALLPNETWDKATVLYNSWVKQSNESSVYWNQHVEIQRSGSKDEVIKLLTHAKAAIEKLDPYEPVGVDGTLAAAVHDYKTASLERIQYAIDIWENRRPSEQHRTDSLQALESAASDAVQREFNRIAFEAHKSTESDVYVFLERERHHLLFEIRSTYTVVINGSPNNEHTGKKIVALCDRYCNIFPQSREKAAVKSYRDWVAQGLEHGKIVVQPWSFRNDAAFTTTGMLLKVWIDGECRRTYRADVKPVSWGDDSTRGEAVIFDWEPTRNAILEFGADYKNHNEHLSMGFSRERWLNITTDGDTDYKCVVKVTMENFGTELPPCP